ncbi:GpE protein [Volucribacter psittacicida]|uniref:GpE protein n=1 Tax=Volucribacter psittacicida TaxID=203482 RepID=A0A4R1FX36_9PAST|nr:GpE family phage tail protein [Volucribacter psittacicida]TCJ95961.1 GpE protein [Volucribacter psittacicida]
MQEIFADLAWWFGWSPTELMELDLEDIPNWVEQMNRQVKAGYVRL